MTPFVHSLALLMLATLVAASTPPAATTCPARLFALQASAARNSTGHENLKAVLQQPEGTWKAWHLDVAAEEQRATGGERIRITTFALSADAEAVGEGGKGEWAALEAKVATLTTQVAEQNETIVELRASNDELKASMALVQGQRNGTGNERGDAELEAKMATQVTELKETIAELRASDEQLKAAMALLQRQLDATVAELKAALRGRLEAVTEAPSTTTSTTTTSTTTTRPLTSEDRTALSKKLLAAAEHKRVEEVRALLAQGAGTEERGREEKTPLHYAADKGDLETLKLLIDHGASLEARTTRQDTPLHYAAGHGHPQCTQALLKAGADLNSRNYNGRTPLHQAATSGYEATVRVLLAAGADHGIRNNDGKRARDLTSNAAIRALLPA